MNCESIVNDSFSETSSGQWTDLARRIGGDVASAIAMRANGVGYFEASAPMDSLGEVASEIAAVAGFAGFATVRSDVELPARVTRQLLHRHLVVLFDPDHATDATVRWIRELSRTSARAHLVVALKDGQPARERGALCAREAVDVGADSSRPDQRNAPAVASLMAGTSIANLEFDRAESVLAAVETEAAVRRWPLPDWVRIGQGQLAFWRGRFEEAERSLRSVRVAGADVRLWRGVVRWAMSPAGEGSHLARLHALMKASSPLAELLFAWRRAIRESNEQGIVEVSSRIRRAGALGIFRWGMRREQMHVLHALPALLQVVHDADDDLAALTGGCRWLARYAGAEFAAIMTVDGTRILAAHGCTAGDVEARGLSGARTATVVETAVDGQAAVTTAPVLSGGATVGYLVVRGNRAAVATLEQGAVAVAALTAAPLRSRLDAIALTTNAQNLVPEMLGRSPALAGIRESIARAAMTSFPVLIEGESGTGKELVARALHRLSRRRDRHFCAINCAALTDELVEAELFGYARGAFTGAVGARTGLFEEAHGGTLFLDEVTELSARAQAKLLRALQEREIRRLGENGARAVDVRIITATNRALTDAVGRHAFREDLLFRLAVVRIRLPALRHRLEDVPLLAQCFWQRLAAEAGKRVSLSPDAIARLCRHQWPGNVRELQNVIAALVVAAPARGRVTARHVGQVIDAADTKDGSASLPLDAARRTCEQRTIAAALARHGGRRSAAARELGLTRQGLLKAIKRLGLEAPRGTEGVA